MLIAFAVRSLQAALVFPNEGEVIFEIGDAWYHLRRALWGMVHFPAVLLHDPLLNHPSGAKVPFPPLWAFLLAAAGRAAGGDVVALERAAAWLPPLLGALALWPTAAAARLFGGPGTALGAAAILAFLPVHVAYSKVGNADHHALVALLGALLLLALLHAVREDLAAPARRTVFAALTAARLALLLSWNGSLLYVALGDATLLSLLIARGAGAPLRAAAASALASATGAALCVALSGEPNGGPWSAVELSRLHVALLAAEAIVAAGVLALERWRSSVSPFRRLLRSVALTALMAGLLLALPETREGLGLAVTWMGQRNPWGEWNAEQLPLFGSALVNPVECLAGFAWLVPLAPLAALAEGLAAGRHPSALLLAAWTGILGGLTLGQVRYGNEFAAGGSVAFALGLARLARVLRPASLPPAVAPAAALLAGTLLLAPGVAAIHAPGARGLWRAVRERPPGLDLGLVQPTGSLARFAHLVRDATPWSAGFADDGRPAYGVLCHPNLGHVLHYAARRATPADNFGPWLGDGLNFQRVQRFYATADENEAFALTDQLRTPWVVTFSFGPSDPAAVSTRLQEADGLAGEHGAALARFRLATEGPADGVPLSQLFGVFAPPPQRRAAAGPSPYKLFEVVKGALVEVPARAGSSVLAEVTVRTPVGRRFTYRAEAQADSSGLARLRLPYATHTTLPARPVALWRVSADGRTQALRLSDAEVREGALVRVSSPPAGS